MVRKTVKNKTRKRKSVSLQTKNLSGTSSKTIFEIVLILIVAGLLSYIFLIRATPNGDQESDASFDFENIKQGLVNCTIYNLTQGNETLHLIAADCIALYSQLAYQQGLSDGFGYAIFEIMNRTRNCSIVPLFYQNYTISVIDVACLQPKQ